MSRVGWVCSEFRCRVQFRFIGCLPEQAHQSTLITSEGGRRTKLILRRHTENPNKYSAILLIVIV